jgi:hypothetical protein
MLVAVMAAGAAAGLAVASKLPETPAAAGPAAGRAVSGGPVGQKLGPTDPRSLFRAGNLRRAVGAVRRRVGPRARLESLRLEAGRADFETLAGRRRELVLAGPDQRLQSLGTEAAPVGSVRHEFSFRRLDPSVPGRLAALLQRRAGVSPKQLAYMVVDVDIISERPGWLVYVKGRQAHYEATIKGGHVVEYGAGRPRKL